MQINLERARPQCSAAVFSTCLLVFLAHQLPSVLGSVLSFLNKLPLFLSMCVPGPTQHCSGTQETGNFNGGSRDSDSQAITLGRKKKKNFKFGRLYISF